MNTKKNILKSNLSELNKKKLIQLVNRIVKNTSKFPSEDIKGCGYWHMHLPVAEKFIDSKKTAKFIRKTCIQTLIDRAYHLSKLKPPNKMPVRVVASINLPSLFASQIIVFFGDNYFSSFFDRNSKEQSWKFIKQQKSLLDEWDLNLPDGFIEKGYYEEIHDEDFDYSGELWFIGELK